MAITKSLTVLLEVREAPDFFPASSPMAWTVFKGQLASYSLSISANSTFTGRVRLSVSSPLPVTAYQFDRTDIGVGETAVLTVNTAELEVGTGGIDIVFEEIV